MKKIFRTLIFSVAAVFATGCNYLDIVPDNILKLEDLFETKEKAYNALGDCYSYLPNNYKVHGGYQMLGDEWIEMQSEAVKGSRTECSGNKVMRGWNNSQNPLLDYWSGANWGVDYYEATRMCNIVLGYLESGAFIIGLEDKERENWIAQIKILKAYYHYFLIRMYGPIIINDKNVNSQDDLDVIRRRRQPVEECFQYVIGLIDEVLYKEDGTERNVLQTTASVQWTGQITTVIAKAIKAKVMVTRASPLFNGNSEYYSEFRDENGNHFFPQEYDANKWKEAYDAVNEAILAAEATGHHLYYFENDAIYDVPSFDEEYWNGGSDIIKHCYNLRYAINQPWNKELIWGNTKPCGADNLNVHNACMIRYDYERVSNTYSHQWLGTSLNIVERFYSKNGVPIEYDETYYNKDQWYSVRTIPSDTYHAGYMQPGAKTATLHLNREPRFYAWIATDRCVWRTWEENIDLKLRNGEDPGGRTPGSLENDFFWTGIAVKKYVHPESCGVTANRTVQFPYPFIRLADLYLLRAECLNEVSGPSKAVYDDINKIRSRAGLPDIEDVWNNAQVVGSKAGIWVNNKAHLRELIHTERLIELSFEGQSYFDILRWKRADEFYNKPVRGWNGLGTTESAFYTETVWENDRQWNTPRDYLMPIPYEEMLKNPNMIQNPYWI